MKEGERQRERGREGGRVCVCVCVSEREEGRKGELERGRVGLHCSSLLSQLLQDTSGEWSSTETTKTIFRHFQRAISGLERISHGADLYDGVWNIALSFYYFSQPVRTASGRVVRRRSNDDGFKDLSVDLLMLTVYAT